jgi:hypothetical protein
MIKTKTQRKYLLTPLRYPGGKTSLFEFFDEVIKEHEWQDVTYIEPYAGGAGKWHEYPWREGQIQEIYRKNNWVHFYAPQTSFVQDGGVYAIRDMDDGGVFLHRTDTKAVFVIVPPKEKNSMYPKVSQEEFELMKAGKWQDGRIPEIELKDSFSCWQNSELVKHEAEYVADLRNRFENKGKTFFLH